MKLSRALLLIATNSVLVFVIGLGVLAGRFAPDPEQPYAPSTFLFTFLFVTAAVGSGGLVWWASVRSVGRSWRELGWHADALPRRLGLGLLGGALAVGVVVLIRLALGDTIDGVLAVLRDVPLPQRLVFTAIGLQAAFVEESLFRGNLQPLLQARLGRVGGLLATAAIFAVYHLNPRLPGLLGKFALGLVFGGLRGRDGSLVPGAIAHALLWVVAGLA
jgi:membrane protease YdiL (CAAX protease family)